jgi:tRNA(fMet)-specific endonuclease VapC
MLDTNLCIRVIRDRPASVRERFQAEAEHLAISTVVLYELHTGVMRSSDPRRHGEALEDFLSRLDVLPFDEAAAYHAGEIKADLLERGQIIGPNDLLIAGHARSAGLKLITGNLREFQRVDALLCEDWF